MIKHEPFIAAFTGTLSTFHTADGRRFTFKKPCPKVVKGAAYMMKLDTEMHTITMIPVNPRVV